MTYDPNDFQDQAAVAAMLQRQRMINSQNQQQSIPKSRQCPWCGGALPGQYSKCQHCASEVSWVDGLPYKPQEAEYRERLSFEKWEKEEKRKAEIAAKKKKFEEALDARVVNCKKCSCRVPQTDLISTIDTCKKCAVRKKFIYNIVTIAALIVCVTLIIGMTAKYEQKQLFIFVTIAVLTVIVTLIDGLSPKHVHKRFVEAKTKAEQQAAEAKAKAKQHAAEAKAKLGEIIAESQAKLTNEIGTGRVGVTLGIPLGGMLVMPFAFCPAGSFTMGSPSAEDGRSDDENQVSVTLSKAFWMAKTEVTQAQWCAVMGSNPSHFKGDNLPVENVSWFDAQEFIKKVDDSGVIPEGWKIALPTEAQWEYACRAGETGTYSGGTVDQVAWYCDNSGSKTHPVGTKKSNAWGLYDMHGNIWEWCLDWYGDEFSGGSDPSGPTLGVFRVSRGGSWCNGAARCRAACRFGSRPAYWDGYLGFRPALVPSE
jgi:formylglycine-generating enzyme required for sulfatase activity